MILLGDCIERLKELEADSVDACITDPPYGLSKEPVVYEVMGNWIKGERYSHKHKGFMGKGWDSFVPGPEYWREVYRVLKPGAHVAIFAGTRTWDLMSISLRFAGFENRDTIASFGGPPAVAWTYGSGFPKSLDISKAIDKAAGAERPVVGQSHDKHYSGDAVTAGASVGGQQGGHNHKSVFDLTAPATDAAKRWQGWGTALKPAWEVILIFRKPLSEKTVAANVLRWGVGGLNIDASRIGYQNEADFENAKGGNAGSANRSMDGWGLKSAIPQSQKISAQGRWPANLILGCECFSEIDAAEGSDHGPDCPVKLLDEQSGHLHGSGNKSDIGDGKDAKGGGASRFFYVAKASKRERNAGLEGMALKSYKTGCGGAMPIDDDGNERDRFQAQAQNTHPTVKPLKLMEYLCKLICPPGGTVLDPFAGSGSTGVAAFRLGFKFIGIEMSEEYAEIAKRRLEHALKESAS